MRASLLYFDGCPNWREADENLRAALDRVDRTVKVEYRTISTPEAAAAAHFVGSPTVLVDDHDPFDDGTGQVGLSCRLYRTEHGLAGSPSVAQLLEVLR